MLNIVGGLLGFIIFYVIDKIKNKFPLLQKAYIYNIMMIVILSIIVLYLSGVIYVRIN